MEIGTVLSWASRMGIIFGVVLGISAFFHLSRWMTEFKSAPGQWYFHPCIFLVKNGELTQAGIKHKRIFWRIWIWWVLTILVTLALGFGGQELASQSNSHGNARETQDLKAVSQPIRNKTIMSAVKITARGATKRGVSYI